MCEARRRHIAIVLACTLTALASRHGTCTPCTCTCTCSMYMSRRGRGLEARGDPATDCSQRFPVTSVWLPRGRGKMDVPSTPIPPLRKIILRRGRMGRPGCVCVVWKKTIQNLRACTRTTHETHTNYSKSSYSHQDDTRQAFKSSNSHQDDTRDAKHSKSSYSHLSLCLV